MIMKRHFTHLVTTLLAGACLVAASCSDSGTDEPKLPQPNFPAPVTATVEAGQTYTFTIEPNQDWQIELPTALSAWYWIQDGSQKVYTKRGTQGKYEISIGVSAQEEFDDSRVCKIDMTMGGKKETILTLTRGTLERSLSVYPGTLDQDGAFATTPEGDEYLYTESPADNFTLAWPLGTTGFSLPIKVEANFDWAMGDMPAWLSPTVTTGAAGATVSLRCNGDVTKYPLDSETGKLIFIDQNNHDVKFEVNVTIPACRDLFSVELESELKFDENANFWSATNGLWLPGSIFGSYLSIKNSKIFILSEKTEADGTTHVSADANDIGWVTLTQENWNDSQEGGVMQSIKFTVGAQVNTGDARKGWVVVLPPAVAAGINSGSELLDAQDIKAEYREYVFGTITQKPVPGTIQPLTPDDLPSVGAKFEKLHSTNKLLKEYNVADAYRLTYTKTWSDDPTSTLVFTKEYTGYRCYDRNGNLIPDADSWITVSTEAKGSIVHMTKQGEGVIVFYDDAGNFAAIDCIYDANVVVDQVKVEFVYPDLVENAELKQITSGKYYEEYKDLGVPIWNLVYTSTRTYTTTIRVPAHAKTVSDSSWLKSEDGSDNEFIVHMNSEKAAEGVLLLQTIGGNTVLVLVCTLAI